MNEEGEEGSELAGRGIEKSGKACDDLETRKKL